MTKKLFAGIYCNGDYHTTGLSLDPKNVAGFQKYCDAFAWQLIDQRKDGVLASLYASKGVDCGMHFSLTYTNGGLTYDGSYDTDPWVVTSIGIPGWSWQHPVYFTDTACKTLAQRAKALLAASGTNQIFFDTWGPWDARYPEFRANYIKFIPIFFKYLRLAVPGVLISGQWAHLGSGADYVNFLKSQDVHFSLKQQVEADSPWYEDSKASSAAILAQVPERMVATEWQLHFSNLEQVWDLQDWMAANMTSPKHVLRLVDLDLPPTAIGHDMGYIVFPTIRYHVDPIFGDLTPVDPIPYDSQRVTAAPSRTVPLRGLRAVQ